MVDYKILNKIMLTSVILSLNLNFTGQPDEYIIKGVLLDKITTFIEWPDRDQNNIDDDHIIVGVYGKHKFGNILKELYVQRKIQNKKLIVKNIYSLSDINECRILFIPKLNEDDLKKILEFVRKKSILTISDTEGYAKMGVQINFYTEENNIRFEINEQSVKESGILMNHLLLSLAKLVE